MKHNEHLKGLAAGMLSVGLYLIIYGLGAGIPLMLLPSLPLFMLGLSRPPAALITACISATMLSLATGPESALFYASFIAMPVLLFAPAAVAARTSHGHFRPVGEILADLSIYAALVYAGIIAYYAGHGSLQQQIAEYLRQSLSTADPQMQETAESLGSTLAFLILAASAWWWVLLVYAHAIIANSLLAVRRQKLRASLALADFFPPPWLLLGLTLAATVSIIGGKELAFGAQTVLLIILLPYFLLGLALMQEKLRSMPGRWMLLFLLYFFTLSLVWPALIIAAAGVWKQCRMLTHPAQYS